VIAPGTSKNSYGGVIVNANIGPRQLHLAAAPTCGPLEAAGLKQGFKGHAKTLADARATCEQMSELS
jgi:hypothetical protein